MGADNRRPIMEWFDVVAFLLGMASLFAFMNERFIHLQSTIGMMLIAVLVSVVGLLFHSFGLVSWHSTFLNFFTEFDFSSTLINGLLCFFLFAGALHIPIRSLQKNEWLIFGLATVGTVVSTFVVGSLCWVMLGLLGMPISYLHALLFGAIISPTDPIAALAILKSVGLPQRLETLINGESLFNDGVAMVLVTVLTGLIYAGEQLSFGNVSMLFGKEVMGGALLGLVIGVVGHVMLEGVKEHSSEVLVTLSVVSGGYALARYIDVSGPIAIVIVGLIIGNYSRRKALDESGRTDLDTFWRMLDEVLNAVLFLLLGMCIVLVKTSWISLVAALATIPIVLFARWVSVSASILVFSVHTKIGHTLWNVIKLLTWRAPRGASSGPGTVIARGSRKGLHHNHDLCCCRVLGDRAGAYNQSDVHQG